MEGLSALATSDIFSYFVTCAILCQPEVFMVLRCFARYSSVRPVLQELLAQGAAWWECCPLHPFTTLTQINPVLRSVSVRFTGLHWLLPDGTRQYPTSKCSGTPTWGLCPRPWKTHSSPKEVESQKDTFKRKTVLVCCKERLANMSKRHAEKDC